MMKHIVILLAVLSQVSIAETYPPRPPRNGGIIGNGKTIEFNNPLLGIQGYFPANWSSLDYGSGLALTPNDESTPFVGISTDLIEDMNTLEELRNHLLLSYPEDNWTEITWNNLSGLKNNSDTLEKTFLLGDDGRVVSIFYKNDENSNSDVDLILDSLRFTQ